MVFWQGFEYTWRIGSLRAEHILDSMSASPSTQVSGGAKIPSQIGSQLVLIVPSDALGIDAHLSAAAPVLSMMALMRTIDRKEGSVRYDFGVLLRMNA